MKEETIKEIIKLLDFLCTQVGETITEYHWRDFAGLSAQIEEQFPEFDLYSYKIELLKSQSAANTSETEGSETTWD